MAVNDAGLSYFAVPQLFRRPAHAVLLRGIRRPARPRLLEALSRETRVAASRPGLRRADGAVRDVMLAASTVEIAGPTPF